MTKLEEIIELQTVAINFAQGYVVQHFQGKKMSDVSLAVNAVAHGYYIGWLYRKQKKEKYIFPWNKPMNEEELQKISGQAALNHMGKKLYGFNKLPPDNRVMMIALIASAFRCAVRKYESTF